jgi:hypothetical protein
VLQVDFLEQLLSYIRSEQRCSIHTSAKPGLDVCMVTLHVDEETSVQRQMQRQKKAAQHNAAVRQGGQGTLMYVSMFLA